VVLAIAVLFLTGMLARVWLFRKLVALGESIIDRIPLIKSLYGAMKDLLQFLGGLDETSRGVPVRIELFDGRVHMMGLLTQRQPESFMGESSKGRVAVYLPMSYQIGGFTVFVERERIEEIEGMTVEDVMKLSMTAGVGSASRGSGPAPAGPAPETDRGPAPSQNPSPPE
jgi:uncharacterized membrane protein